jgi:hypothetical protein
MRNYALSIVGLAFLILAVSLVFSGGAWTQEEKKDTVKVAREVLQKHKDAIVNVALVVKTKFIIAGNQMEGGEEKLEINGTVVAPSGLTIVSNSQTEPGSMFGAFDQERIKTESTVTDAKIVLASGKEYPAKVILRDRDLDLVFIKPEEKELNLPCIGLTEPSEPKILDEIIALSRLDRSCNRQPCVNIGRITSIIEKPRVQYIVNIPVALGCPVLDASGNLLGLAVARPGAFKSISSLDVGAFLSAFSVIPCRDITKAIKDLPAEQEKEKK